MVVGFVGGVGLLKAGEAVGEVAKFGLGFIVFVAVVIIIEPPQGPCGEYIPSANFRRFTDAQPMEFSGENPRCFSLGSRGHHIIKS
ncbi:MAG TPA: hypothetical protein VFC46_05790 [Humisphaera sp.]|nr:hypothetical protein [Humisphaera sp.]